MADLLSQVQDNIGTELANVVIPKPRRWKRNASIVNCHWDEREHTWLDNCWNCAPWWFKVPVCPDDKRKLTWTGFCSACRGHFNINL